MIELGQLEAKAGEFEKRNVRVIAVSLDNLEDSQATQAKFPHLVVVADHEKKMSEKLQVIHGSEGPGGAAADAPTTILVDGRGVVRWVFRPERFLERLSPAQLLAAIDEHMPDREASATEKRDAALTEVIRTGMKRASIPGAIVGVWRDGQPLYVRAFGVRDTATSDPMTTDLHMRIGSNTKAFVTTAVLMLADQGKVGLDDTIDRYVKDVPNGDKITLRQLAQMRSGLYNYVDDTSKDMHEHPFKKWTPPELLEVAFRHPPIFKPGAQFDYCNTNTVLLGLVVEKVSGQSLASFIEEKILKPQGLTHTVIPAGAEMPSPYAHGYFKTPDGKIVDASDWNPSWGWASGNMISTLDDMRVWTHSLAVGKLLSPAMKNAQQEFLPAPEEGDGALYGLALENQNGWIGHNGNIMSYMVYPYYLPSEKMTMVVMLNTGAEIPGSWRMIQDITRIISPNNVWPGLPKD